MKPVFVNEAFEKAINDYLVSKDKQDGVLYNSFLVVVIRILINIYGELDIINPYKIQSEETLDNNLTKYGASKDKIDYFKRVLDGFYTIDNRNVNSAHREENIYFVEVQKELIDFYNLKRLNFGLTENEKLEFFDLLYTAKTSNPLRLSYNYLNAENIYEVEDYYKVAMSKVNKPVEEEKNLLNLKIYELFNYKKDDLDKMSAESIDRLNSQIYKSFDIKESLINKEYLLEEKFKSLTMKEEPLTTGNGYVDILLIMSIIVTVVMVIIIFATIVL